MIAHQRRFKDTTVFLDGSTFVGCTFTNCMLVFSGYIPLRIERCTFEKCSYQFAGPAGDTLRFLSFLFAQEGASRDLVEHIFESVRQGSTGPDGGPVTLN